MSNNFDDRDQEPLLQIFNRHENQDELTQARQATRAIFKRAWEERTRALLAPPLQEMYRLLGPHPSAQYIAKLPTIEEACDPCTFDRALPEGLHAISENGENLEAAAWTSDILPRGQLSVLRGIPKSGKTLVAIEIASRLSNGEAVLDIASTDTPSSTLLLAASEGGELVDHWPRFFTAHANLRHVDVATHEHFFIEGAVNDISVLTFTVEGPKGGGRVNLSCVERTARNRKVSLLVVNTLRALMHSVSQSAFKQVLDELSEVAYRLQAAVLIVDYNDRTARAKLIEQRARVALDLNIDSKDPSARVLRVSGASGTTAGHSWRFRIDGVDGVPCITWLAQDERSFAQDAQSQPKIVSAKPGPAQRDDLKAWLRSLLQGRSMLVEEVNSLADKLGYPRISVRRAFGRLNGISEPLNDGTTRRVWRLPHESMK